MYYKHFYGNIIFPSRNDYVLAYKIQLELVKKGVPQTFSDLTIACIAIKRGEPLLTYDGDFKVIGDVAKTLGYTLSLVS